MMVRMELLRLIDKLRNRERNERAKAKVPALQFSESSLPTIIGLSDPKNVK